MGIEQNVSKPKGKVYNESKKNKRRQRKSSQVQRLYEICKEVFADCGPGVVPSNDKLELLKSVLGMIVFFSYPSFSCLLIHVKRKTGKAFVIANWFQNASPNAGL